MAVYIIGATLVYFGGIYVTARLLVAFCDRPDFYSVTFVCTFWPFTWVLMIPFLVIGLIVEHAARVAGKRFED